MPRARKIIFTVTTDLNYDQRMIRICSSLQAAGYEVHLHGIKRPWSKPLENKAYKQTRQGAWFNSGKLFYAEANIRMFFKLLFTSADAICSIDLDSILPGYIASKLRRKPLVYDAHEYFTGMEEVVSRPRIQAAWKKIERTVLPNIKWGYTIGPEYARLFKEEYGLEMDVVRNIAMLQDNPPQEDSEGFIIYQGAVNHGRALKETATAAKDAQMPLQIYGFGNLWDEMEVHCKDLSPEVELLGYKAPDDLRQIAPKALAGLTLFEKQGMSNYYSLANRFFDYIHAGIPQIAMNYPEYKNINEQYEVAVLIDDLEVSTISAAMSSLRDDKELANRLRENARKARLDLNWQKEAQTLVLFWDKVFASKT